MTSVEGIESLLRNITRAQADALRVHDSPVRSDRLFAEVERISSALDALGLDDERSVRASANLADAMRVLRREDDGREAARHLQAALTQFEVRSRKPSPFPDDA